MLKLKRKPKPKKDTAFVATSARVRVLENKLLTHERMEALIEAREDGEVVKLLQDCGYGEIPTPITPAGVERALGDAQAVLFDELDRALGEKSHVLPVFQIKYDYHNAKSLVKGEAVGADPAPLLVSGGRYDREKLHADYREARKEGYSPAFVNAIEEARSLIATSCDPQLADFLLDRACYAEILSEAQAEAEPFLVDYVTTLIDALNLQMAVRAARSGKSGDLLARALLEGGHIPPAELTAENRPSLAQVYKASPLLPAAQMGDELLAGGGDLAAFQRQCDNTVVAQVKKARQVPFGLPPIVGYLFARQSELTAIRILLSGRMAGLPKDTIRERLRDAYA